MKRLDRLILLDIVGPWLFGVGLFTALIMAATYLGRLAGFIVDGVPPLEVAELTMLYMPQILVKTFSMAVLLAGLLGFGRLSSDSEITALRAGGASIYRIVAPVGAFSLVISFLTLAFDEIVVPSATARSVAVTDDARHRIHPGAEQPIWIPIVTENKLRAAVVARNVNPANEQLQGVTVIAYDKTGAVSGFLLADFLEVEGNGMPNATNWKLLGHVKYVPSTFDRVVQFDDGFWPNALPQPSQPFAQAVAEDKENPDSMTMAELRTAIARHRVLRDKTEGEIHDFEYGYWNKLAIPLAAITFGCLGAVLGIRGHRTGTATGMALAIAIIFGYVTLANFMNVWAINGLIPAWCASFAPLVIGGGAAGVIMWRRNK